MADNLGALSLAMSPEQIDRLDLVSSLNPSAPARTPIAWGVK